MTEKLEQKLLDYMRRPGYRPLNKSELARALELNSKDRPALRESLRQLERAGTILRAKKGRFVLQEKDDQTVTGTYRSRRRAGELVVAEGDAGKRRVKHRRVVIPEGSALTAMDGDCVLVRLRRPREEPHWLKHLPKAKQERLREGFQRGDGRREGEVIKVIKRASRTIVGTLVSEGEWSELTPDDERLPDRIRLAQGIPEGARSGFKALVTITGWDSVRKPPEGKVIRVLGAADEPGVDILSIIYKHGLPVEFPEDVLAEAGAVAASVSADELQEREDWREAEVITIDPFDARDFDDAIAVKRLPQGGWELAVHIADVSYYVRPGTALDGEAKRRGNSVYMVDRVLPMLPEALSNGICSLRPDEDRLTFCVVMRFDAKGERTSARFTSAIIRSRKRLSYEEAFARLQGEGPKDDIGDLLERAWELAFTLRQRRFRKGSLDLDFPERKVILDERGHPTEISVVENDESHQLIEECMLAANEAVAETILQSGKPSLYRIHEDPDPAKLEEFREFVLQHGYKIGDLTHRRELQRLLTMLRGQPDEPVLKLGLLKSLKRAVYHADSLGHYGLAKEHYTHFTSPIRRYSDLVVHRVLRRVMGEESADKTPSYKVMGEFAGHLSSTERRAGDAETEGNRLKVTEYFDMVSRNDPGARFEVLITDVLWMGLSVEIVGYATRGLIRVQDFPGDEYYRYEPHHLRFHGGKGRVYRVGDRLKAEVVAVDRRRGYIDLRPVPG